MNKNILLKGHEVATLLGISRSLAYQWMREGVLPTFRQGKVARVPLPLLEVCDGPEKGGEQDLD